MTLKHKNTRILLIKRLLCNCEGLFCYAELSDNKCWFCSKRIFFKLNKPWTSHNS